MKKIALDVTTSNNRLHVMVRRASTVAADSVYMSLVYPKDLVIKNAKGPVGQERRTATTPASTVHLDEPLSEMTWEGEVFGTEPFQGTEEINITLFSALNGTEEMHESEVHEVWPVPLTS